MPDNYVDQIQIDNGSVVKIKDTLSGYTTNTGDVVGPSSATNGNVVLFDGTTGKLIKNSSYTINKSVPSDAVFTDVSVTSSSNHYTPSTVSGSDLSASASGATASWSIDVVKGVTLNTDSKGHVTGVSVTSGKIPANPNTDTKVRQTLSTTNKNYPLLLSYGESSDTTANIDNVSYRANTIYANPSTGNIQATKLNGVDIGSSPKFTDTTYTGTGLISINSSNVISTPSQANVIETFKVNGTTVTPSSKAVDISVPTITDTYSSTSTDGMSGKAVASALGTLDVTGASSISASKTISAWSETDGKVSITTQDISITKSQVSDFPTLGTASAKDVPASGNASTTQVVMGNDTRLSDSRTPTSHTHGNIQNGGTLQTNDITIANGDKLVVTDSSDSSKVARTSISFDGSTTTKCLTQKGTWASFTNNSGTITGITMNGSSVGTSGTVDLGTVVTDTSDKMDKANPTGTGAISINRKANTTVGLNSVAMGSVTTASGDFSTALGNNTVASGRNSFAIGANTTASGDYSLGLGNATSALGDDSLAMGYASNTEADATCSVSFGAYSNAWGECQFVFGQNNIPNTTDVEIVGWGSLENKANIRTLDRSGNETLAGSLHCHNLYIDEVSMGFYYSTTVATYITVNTGFTISNFQFYRVGKLVTMSGALTWTSSAHNTSSMTIGTLAQTNMYPEYVVFANQIRDNGSNSKTDGCKFRINHADGVISINPIGSQSTAYADFKRVLFNISYISKYGDS